jgi:thioesterase domain-containing protein/acyl carrier protein
VEHKTAATMTEVLTSIWEGLLERSPIDVQENFFDLGGDSSLAVELFNKIAKEFDRKLSPVTIYQAPTIASLSALLEKPTTPRLPSLLPLKAGTGYPPVFLAHGLGGNAMDFFQLVRHIPLPHPIYGIQARGTDGVDEPYERIEDMAKFHLGAIRELQPQGPYLLVGFSFGGLIALEMARHLSENGEKIALLVLLETYPHSRYLPIGQRLRLMVGLAKHHASTLLQLPFSEALSYILRPAERLSHLSREANGSARNRPSIELWFTPAMQRVRSGAYKALENYRPRFYDGKIKFVGAQIPSEFPDDPTAVWASLASEFEVETIPGDHLGILKTHFESVAVLLTRYLEEAISQK